MKTACTLKNGRLPDTAGQHGMTPGRITQMGILLYQCFHGGTMPELT
jgi:hypothetical protein